MMESTNIKPQNLIDLTGTDKNLNAGSSAASNQLNAWRNINLFDVKTHLQDKVPADLDLSTAQSQANTPPNTLTPSKKKKHNSGEKRQHQP